MSFLYKLYTGDETNLGSVDTIEGETFESEGTDVEELTTTVSKSPGAEVKANILTEHIATGKKAVYDVLTVFILDPEVTEFTASLEDSEIDPGDTTQVNTTITVQDSDNDTINYASEDTDIATVDSSGEVTAVASGIVNITAEPDLNPSLVETMELTVSDLVKVAASEPESDEFTTA